MERIIKFRAWVDNYGESSDIVPQMVYQQSVKGFAHIPDLSFLDGHHVNALMQFTGKHDKNGKEIYEGDILEFENPGGIQRPYVAYQGELAAFVVDYWRKGQKESHGDFLHEIVEGIENVVEIIGNVHQHPHLLQNSNAKAGTPAK